MQGHVEAFLSLSGFSLASTVSDWFQTTIYDGAGRLRRREESDNHVSRVRIPGIYSDAGGEQ